jgi:hypothetical protein
LSLRSIFAWTTLFAAGLALCSLAASDFARTQIATSPFDRTSLAQIRALEDFITKHDVSADDLVQLIETGSTGRGIERDGMYGDSIRDSWGYCFAVRREGERVTGIYSLGQDGVSQSGGDDPDDISSWNGVGEQYKQSRSRLLAFRVGQYFFSSVILVASVSIIARQRRTKA